uniref:Uncharacterized protein n=1 Tax=Gadus morhua TaxID=8049 RepID=A0A8C5AH61_GADMO
YIYIYIYIYIIYVYITHAVLAAFTFIPVDGGQPSNSFGNGQPSRTPQHTRPFFYVQPASQPYVPMYQHWHLNNPYNPYGMPGGYNVGRPYGQPYPYMQYPGYVLPQQMMHPLDYRRMFEPRFHPPPWADMPRPPQQPQQEMACSEVQTDPSDAINKLIECLGKMRGVELGVAERELDSGVGSQTSGIFSPGEEKKSDEEGVSRAAVSTSSSSSSSSGAQPSPGVTFSDSTTAVYDAESSHRSLEDLGTPGAWSVGFEEPPLDSSSVREETPSGAPEPAEKRDLFAFCLPGPLPDRVTVAPRGEERPTEVVDRRSDGVAPVVLVTTTSVDLGSDPEEPLPETVAVLHQAQEVWCPTAVPVEAEADLSYRILRLPFDPSAPFAGDLLRSSPSSRGTEPARLAPGCLPSPVSPLYYGYLPRQRTQERLSVLSPSLDELSSRDEMFSTDLDDMDLFPRRVYASRRPVASGHRTTEEAWPAGAKRYSCACCGKGLAKAGGPAASRSKGSDVRSYRDETGDSDDECRYARTALIPVCLFFLTDMHRKAPSKMMPCHRTREEESKNEEPPSRYRWERGDAFGVPLLVLIELRKKRNKNNLINMPFRYRQRRTKMMSFRD